MQTCPALYRVMLRMLGMLSLLARMPLIYEFSTYREKRTEDTGQRTEEIGERGERTVPLLVLNTLSRPCLHFLTRCIPKLFEHCVGQN